MYVEVVPEFSACVPIGKRHRHLCIYTGYKKLVVTGTGIKIRLFAHKKKIFYCRAMAYIFLIRQ